MKKYKNYGKPGCLTDLAKGRALARPHYIDRFLLKCGKPFNNKHLLSSLAAA
ncbi:MAG: hypothetical protein NVV59_04555 [Chitinophagaceae bacterium]|nr:hypothetical protein [Chitinophagaceae bacterium]